MSLRETKSVPTHESASSLTHTQRTQEKKTTGRQAVARARASSPNRQARAEVDYLYFCIIGLLGPMSGNPWGKKDVGGATKLDWSEQVEEEEAQNGGVLSHKTKAQEPDGGAFPTLGEAAKVKAPKKKMTLAEFQKVPEAESSGKYRVGGYGRRELTEQEIKMSLPTGPRERDPNEPRGGDRRGGWGDDRGGGGGTY